MRISEYRFRILSTKTFHVPPKINTQIGYCKKTIDRVILNLEQRKVRTAINEQKNVLASMNEIAFLLMNSNSDLAGGSYLAAGRDRTLCQNGYQVSAVFSMRVMIVVKLVDGDTNFGNGAG